MTYFTLTPPAPKQETIEFLRLFARLCSAKNRKNP